MQSWIWFPLCNDMPWQCSVYVLQGVQPRKIIVLRTDTWPGGGGERSNVQSSNMNGSIRYDIPCCFDLYPFIPFRRLADAHVNLVHSLTDSVLFHQWPFLTSWFAVKSLHNIAWHFEGNHTWQHIRRHSAWANWSRSPIHWHVIWPMWVSIWLPWILSL